MPNRELDYSLPDGRQPLPGFRLRRLEMLNWGTFHEKVAVLVADGRWTLLVGENGSGKSTAVDALRTLLVPPRLLNYNDASADQKRRGDRTRQSYIRGAWQTVSQEDSAKARPEYLRSEGVQSILLAVFANEHNGEVVTLVQVLWELNEKHDERFAVAREDKTIKDHLSNLGSTRELMKNLRQRGFDPFDSFSAYSKTFCSRLGIASETALEVFNQAIGVKEVGDINSFVRRHMLEGSNATDFIHNRLRPHFNELDACWRAIERAQNQLDALKPIADAHDKIEEAKLKRLHLQGLLDALPLFYAHRHLTLRREEAIELEERLGELRRQKQDIEAVQKRDEDERDAKLQEIAANITAQSIARIETQMTAADERRKSKLNKWNEFAGQTSHQTRLINEAEKLMLPLMANFLHDCPEHSANLRAEANYAGDFAALRIQIDKEELPQHKQRFEEFLGTNLIGDMAMFQSNLHEHEKAIRRRVEAVNQALVTIAFSDTTHVQITAPSTRADDIKQFRARLKDCLRGGLNPSADDRLHIFKSIRELIGNFEKDEAWTRHVTDARNWFEFGIRELADADKREINYYSASSGKSGGQKAKLAFTILASAITAQYGLLGADSDADTFRLVVIDEVFARTDEANSLRALRLFQKLGLQLIVVNPFDAKGRIVEDFVDSFHLAVNPDGNNSKLRRASRAEYEAAQDQAEGGGSPMAK